MMTHLQDAKEETMMTHVQDANKLPKATLRFKRIVHELTKPQTTVGSSSAADIQVHDKFIMPIQFEINLIRNEQCNTCTALLKLRHAACALEPTRPTYVNGRPVNNARVLASGDEITFGYIKYYCFVFAFTKTAFSARKIGSMFNSSTPIKYRSNKIEDKVKQTMQTPVSSSSFLRMPSTPKFSPNVARFFQSLSTQTSRIIENFGNFFKAKDVEDEAGNTSGSVSLAEIHSPQSQQNALEEIVEDKQQHAPVDDADAGDEKVPEERIGKAHLDENVESTSLNKKLKFANSPEVSPSLENVEGDWTQLNQSDIVSPQCHYVDEISDWDASLEKLDSSTSTTVSASVDCESSLPSTSSDEHSTLSMASARAYTTSGSSFSSENESNVPSSWEPSMSQASKSLHQNDQQPTTPPADYDRSVIGHVRELFRTTTPPADYSSQVANIRNLMSQTSPLCDYAGQGIDCVRELFRASTSGSHLDSFDLSNIQHLFRSSSSSEDAHGLEELLNSLKLAGVNEEGNKLDMNTANVIDQSNVPEETEAKENRSQNKQTKNMTRKKRAREEMIPLSSSSPPTEPRYYFRRQPTKLAKMQANPQTDVVHAKRAKVAPVTKCKAKAKKKERVVQESIGVMILEEERDGQPPSPVRGCKRGKAKDDGKGMLDIQFGKGKARAIMSKKERACYQQAMNFFSNPRDELDDILDEI